MNPQLSIPGNALTAFCRARGIKRLAIFGSALRDDFGPESDVDVLVEFKRGRAPGLLSVADMELELAELFGRKVDLVLWSAVVQSRNYIRRNAILDSAEEVYAA